MKKKSEKAVNFVRKLHEHIVRDPQFRKNTETESEKQIQTELRPLMIRYLEDHFRKAGYKRAKAKANQSFYWEGQEGSFKKLRDTTFGSRNYPDFIITNPYSIAIEYKQAKSGSLVKRGIGQSMMHTLSGDFDFVYFLFHDQSPEKNIQSSIKRKSEASIVKCLWDDFNVLVKFV